MHLSRRPHLLPPDLISTARLLDRLNYDGSWAIIGLDLDLVIDTTPKQRHGEWMGHV